MSEFTLTGLTSALADRYRIERELGAGGMATVFLAEDLKHHRKVALKVLKAELTAALGAERFVKEITTTAALQHPHILPLFDSGNVDGFLFYVMPFIDGETLRTRIHRETQLPVAEAVQIAREVADALDYAHHHGIIHRDIKPENILLHGGHALVADFGIALAVSAAAGSRLTETGFSLGTPQYMSPEQAAADKETTARSDVYSLGSVLYEMLAGQPPHTGASAQQIIMKVIAEPAPSIATLRKSVPPNVSAALAKALEKVAADRFASARAFAAALADPRFAADTEQTGTTLIGNAHQRAGGRAILRHPLVLGLAALLLISVVLNATRARQQTVASPPQPTLRFAFAGTDSAGVAGGGSWPAAISPDGSLLVYSAVEDPRSNATALHLRRSDRLDAPTVRGTAGGSQPIFSPDGQWLAFVADETLKKVRLDGTAPVTIVVGAGSQNGADWTTKDEIIVGATGAFHGLSHVSAAGGKLTPLTRPDSAKGERDHFWPIALPDGRHIVFAVWSGSVSTAELAMTSLDDGRVAPLGLHGVRPLAVLDGALVYHQADGMLMAVRLDVAKRKIIGIPVPVHDPVPLAASSSGEAVLFLSSGGALVSALPSTTAQLTWVSRDGSRRPMSPDRRDFSMLRISPNQTRLAVLVGTAGKYDVWIHDFVGGTLSRLTASADVTSLAWTPDGTGVVFGDNAGNIWSQSIDRATPPSALVRSLNLIQAVDLSPDGRSLLVEVWSENRWACVRVALDSGATVHLFSASRGWDALPRFSPDGHWAAMNSNESGTWEVYVRSFPDPFVKLQVSAGGGAHPVWSADGTRLYYKAGKALIAARLEREPTLRIVSRDTIFSAAAELPDNFDVVGNGARFAAPFRASSALQLEIAINWLAEFRARMGTSKR